MSVWWANDLKSKNDSTTARRCSIPPVTGLIVEVTPTDTLDSLAARYGVNRTDILATNGLDDPNLVVGQVLVVPGAKGDADADPEAASRREARQAGDHQRQRRPPATYRGGTFLWPVVGGGNYISQYFHYGHYAHRHRRRLRLEGPRRRSRHRHLRGLEEQRRRLPGLDRARLRPVHDVQPHVGDLGRARPARRPRPAGRPGRPIRQRDRPAPATSRSGSAQSGPAGAESIRSVPVSRHTASRGTPMPLPALLASRRSRCDSSRARRRPRPCASPATALRGSVRLGPTATGPAAPCENGGDVP